MLKWTRIVIRNFRVRQLLDHLLQTKYLIRIDLVSFELKHPLGSFDLPPVYVNWVSIDLRDWNFSFHF